MDNLKREIDGLTPYEVFMKFYYDHSYWKYPNNRLFYRSMDGFGDKLFVIERIGTPLEKKFGYLTFNDVKFIVTDCDELTEKESTRYKIIREQMEAVDRERAIQSDLDHLEFSRNFVKFLGLDNV